MSVLWKKTDFYKEESDREVIIIAAGGLGEGAASLPHQAGFPIMGPFPPHESLNREPLLLPEMGH